MAQIHEAIVKIIQEVGPIGKNKQNKEQGFKYRGVDDVMNELQPLFAKNGIFVIPEVIEAAREEKPTKTGGTLRVSVLTVKVSFCASDGSSVSAIVVGEGMDSGDKASNKAMAVAFKYACLQVFCIPTEDMSDPDGESPRPQSARQDSPPPATARPQPAPRQQAPAPQVQKPAPEAAKRPTRGQIFNYEMKEAGLTPEEATKAVYSVVDAFKFPTTGNAINLVDEATFQREIAAVREAGVAKRQAQEIDAEAMANAVPAELF
jgi:hypothetical protein